MRIKSGSFTKQSEHSKWGQRSLEHIEEIVPFIRWKNPLQKNDVCKHCFLFHSYFCGYLPEKCRSPRLPQLPNKNLHLTQLEAAPRKHLNTPKRESLSRREQGDQRNTSANSSQPPVLQEEWLVTFKPAENLWHVVLVSKQITIIKPGCLRGQVSPQLHLTSDTAHHNTLYSDAEYALHLHSHQSLDHSWQI